MTTLFKICQWFNKPAKKMELLRKFVQLFHMEGIPKGEQQTPHQNCYSKEKKKLASSHFDILY